MALQAVSGDRLGSRIEGGDEARCIGAAAHARSFGAGRATNRFRAQDATRQGRCDWETRRIVHPPGSKNEARAMKPVTIYHNPRCGTSRKTLERLRGKGIEPTIIEYLKTPPSAAELETILTLLRMEPRDLMRKKEDAYRERRLDEPSLTRRQLIQAMVEEPILIERPIVLAGGKAALGRPPERVEAIL